MKILITGGAGYIGSHTAVELFSAGHTPVILDNFVNSEPFVIDRIGEIVGARPALYEGDCIDRNFVQEVFAKEQGIGAVIHFAGYKAVGESIQEPLKYYRNNLLSLITVLEAMSAHGCMRIVFSSSATVYGEPDVNPIPETAPRKKAMSPYGATKVMCEDILEDATKSGVGVRAIALRYFNPIGAHPSGKIGELPKGTPNNLVPYLTQAVVGVRPQLTVFGDDYDTEDGTCIRDFIHVVDLAKAHVSAVECITKEGIQPYDVYNVGTGAGTSVRTLIDTFERVNKTQVPHVIGQRREGDIASCYARVEKIAKDMGWHAERTLEDALVDAWRWELECGKK
jgi:UDP-glucose 4-epimerase